MGAAADFYRLRHAPFATKACFERSRMLFSLPALLFFMCSFTRDALFWSVIAAMELTGRPTNVGDRFQLDQLTVCSAQLDSRPTESGEQQM